LVNSTISPPAPSSYSVNFTNLTDGTYYLNATGFDTSNNLDSTETRVIRLDTVAPVINLSLPVDGFKFCDDSGQLGFMDIRVHDIAGKNEAVFILHEFKARDDKPE